MPYKDPEKRRECRRNWDRTHPRLKPYNTKRKLVVQKYSKKRKVSRRSLIALYKLIVGCMDCGYKEHSEALDFDHRPGVEKKFNLSRGYTLPLEEIIAEIEKCDVVCANCHRVRTASRRGIGVNSPEI